jgi:hypothetical protein
MGGTSNWNVSEVRTKYFVNDCGAFSTSVSAYALISSLTIPPEGFEIKRYRSPYTLEVGNLPAFNMRVTF